MNTIILTSFLDFYEKDEQGNKIAHNFGNDNGILDCLKSNIKKYDNFVFVANGMEGEKAEAYFKLACNSFELTLPFNNYEFLCPSTKNRAKEMIEKADFIFLCGGHLPTQNKFFNDIGLKELLKNTNALIVGGSAGSMNCADVVYCPPELEEEVLDDNFNRYLKGLGLYHLRWGIETSFRQLKYTVGLSLFQSKKVEYITQEIFARLTMYNFCELITSHAVIQNKRRKYVYQTNFTAAVHICRQFLRGAVAPPKVEALIKMQVVPIRPGRSTPRRTKNIKFNGFFYRIA